MDLSARLKNKLFSLEKKIIKARQGALYLQQLLYKIKDSVKEDTIRQVFIRKEIELMKTKVSLSAYTQELLIYQKYKEIILEKNRSIQKALELLEEMEDRITNLTADVQAMIIYLSYSEFNR